MVQLPHCVFRHLSITLSPWHSKGIDAPHVFDFHYNVMLPKYGSNLKLLMTDTDSLVYEISSDDPQYDMYDDLVSIKSEFDFSDYPEAHPLHTNQNKKIAGKFKDDKATIIKEFCGIRAKMYSLLMANHNDIVEGAAKLLVKDYEQDKIKKGFKRDSEGTIVKTKPYLTHDGVKIQKDVQAYESFTAKGVKTNVAEGELRHEDFKNCLLHSIEAPHVFIPTLRSVKHQVYMFDSKKKTLDALDDKRHTLFNGCDSLAHGHYQITNGYTQLYEKASPPPQLHPQPAPEPMVIEHEYGSWNQSYTGCSEETEDETLDEHEQSEILDEHKKRQKLGDDWSGKIDQHGNFKACSIDNTQVKRSRGMFMSMDKMRALRT